jgi:hypothetical protein
MSDLNKLSDAQLGRLADKITFFEFLLEDKNMRRLTAPRVPVMVGYTSVAPIPVPRDASTPAEDKLRKNDPKSKRLSFLRGWRHYLWQVPYPKGYEMTSAHEAVPYESGRHAAALYEQECRAKGFSIKGGVAYAVARREMSVELRRMIDAERKWCAIKLKQGMAKRLTSEG